MLADLHDALGRERHHLARRPELLWQQVTNRTLAGLPAPDTRALLEQLAESGPWRARPWFRQIWAPPEAAKIVLQAHEDWVVALATGVSGERVLTGGRDGVLNLWDAASGRLLATLDNHGGWVYDCVLFDGDRRALSCGGDHLARLWNLESRSLEAAFEHPDEVRGCAVHEGRGLFATACYDGGIRVGSLAERSLIFGVPAHRDRANTVAFTPDGSTVVSGGRDGTLSAIDVSTGTVVRQAAAGANCFDVTVAPTGDRCVVAHGNGDVSLWTLDGLREVARVHGAHTGEVLGCAVSPDGGCVASVGTDGTLAIWSSADLVPIARFPVHANAAFSCAFLSGDSVATASADTSARITCVSRAARAAADLESPLASGPVWSVIGEPEGTVLVAVANGTIVRVDPAAGTRGATTDLAAGTGPYRLAPLVDGRVLVGATGLLAYWDPASGQVDSVPLGNVGVTAIVTTEGRTIAVLADGRLALVGEPLSGVTPIPVLDGRPGSEKRDSNWAVWSACALAGRLVAIGATRGVVVWDPAEARVIGRLPLGGSGYALGVSTLPGRTLMFVGDTSGSLSVFESRGMIGGAS